MWMILLDIGRIKLWYIEIASILKSMKKKQGGITVKIQED